jgi:hypothetical protein
MKRLPRIAVIVSAPYHMEIPEKGNIDSVRLAGLGLKCNGSLPKGRELAEEVHLLSARPQGTEK